MVLKFSQQDVIVIHAWIRAVLTDAEHTFENELSLYLNEDDMKSLSFTQRHFVITATDKAANNFCSVSKKHYLQLSLNEFRREVTNEPGVSVTDMESFRMDNQSVGNMQYG